jgi:hypothetical protein
MLRIFFNLIFLINAGGELRPKLLKRRKNRSSRNMILRRSLNKEKSYKTTLMELAT